MKAVICVLACLAVGALAQIRPHISETFEGEGYSHIITTNETIWGLGHWVIDEPAGHAIEFWEFAHEHRHRSIHILKRYDLGFEFAIFHHHEPPHVRCHKIAVKPPMPPAWHWLRDAHYAGKHARDGTTYDWWRHHHQGVELEVAVSEHDASRPHYFIHRSAFEHRTTHLISFATFKPNATWFNVPEACKNATESTTSITDAIAEEMTGGMGSDTTIKVSCAIAASSAARLVFESNGYDAASLVAAAFQRAGVSTPSTSLWELQAGGSRCSEGPAVGDVFFDGLPAVSAAVYLGDNKFAECPAAMGGRCAIVEQRDFTGGCRRFC